MKTSEDSEIIFIRLVNNLYMHYETEDQMPIPVQELVNYTRKRTNEILNQNENTKGHKRN